MSVSIPTLRNIAVGLIAVDDESAGDWATCSAYKHRKQQIG